MERHLALVEARVAEWCDALPSDGLYAPMAYLMRLRAKRVRPLLTLLGCELFGGRAEDALDEALGIEVFHNFTLMHDDLMDASPLRRGGPAVHAKWNANTAILSGDAMLVKAYALMGKRPGVLDLFNRYALQVCEGQQLDMEFEQRTDVSLAAYTEMIRLKTAVLLSCALQAGAAVAGAPVAERERLGAFGEHLGLAFQLRDDLLDAFGETTSTGKQRGGDLRAGKKTFLLIRGLERAAAEGSTVLAAQLALPPGQRDVRHMAAVIEQLGVRAEAEAEAERQEGAASEALDVLPVPEARKEPLRCLAEELGRRRH
ncbi:MAG: polyprenyl synthetase family protein [Flavobacteriales bacterium]